jgi:hypothetical protein
MINSAHIIIESAIPSNEVHITNKLVLALSKYCCAISILNKHYKLSDDEMDEFQDTIDDFFALWVDVFGMDSVTNYMHLLGSGHMLYFLKHYRCFHLYRQYGWESLMGKVQAILHLNNQREGYGSGGGKRKSYIYPVMLFILRDLLWKTVKAQEFFKHLDKKEPDKIGNTK